MQHHCGADVPTLPGGKDFVSGHWHTLLSQLDFIQDVNAEIEAVEAQKKANLETYGFGLPNTLTEDEEDEEEAV